MKTFFGKISEPLGIFCFFLIVFLLSLTANFTGPHDSLEYLNLLLGGKNFFHPNHLLYHNFTMYALHMLQAIFPGIKPFYLVETISALWSCGTLTIVYLFFRNRFTLSVVTAFIGCCVIAFSYGIWFYSVNVEVYNPPIFFLITSLYILTKKNLSKKDFVWVFVLNGFAILFHQVNILFIPVVLYKIWQQRKQLNALSLTAIYSIIGLVLVGGGYFYIGWVLEKHASFTEWFAWLKGYAGSSEYVRSLGIMTPVYAFIGFAHAFIGGQFAFKVSFIEDYLNKTLSGHGLTDEVYLVHNMSHGTALLLLIITLVAAVLILILLIQAIRKWKTIRKEEKNNIAPLLLTFAIYSIFFCFWMPEILEFWLLQCIIFWMLLVGISKHIVFPFKMKTTTYFSCLVVALFVINYFGSIRWLKDINNDLGYKKIEKIKDVAKSADLVILRDGWIIHDFVQYYTPAQVIDLPAADSLKGIHQLNEKVQHTLQSGNKVYIFTGASSVYSSGNTSYIDSLLKANANKHTIFQKEITPIVVIE